MIHCKICRVTRSWWFFYARFGNFHLTTRLQCQLFQDLWRRTASHRPTGAEKNHPGMDEQRTVIEGRLGVPSNRVCYMSPLKHHKNRWSTIILTPQWWCLNPPQKWTYSKPWEMLWKLVGHYFATIHPPREWRFASGFTQGASRNNLFSTSYL